MIRVAGDVSRFLVVALVCWIANTETCAAQSAQSCWMAYGGREPTPGDYEDETLCIMSDTEGFVRESTLYGTGVEGCNSIKITKGADAVSLFVDYSNCTNDSPNHTIVCPSLAGDLVKCAESHEARPEEGSWDTYLKSCPAHRCDEPLRR
jgi:hypothetical protein